MKHRSCDDLGVCQAYAECHVSCSAPPTPTYAFAPGVVEFHRRRWLGTPAQRRELLRCLKWALLWAAVTGGVGMAFGLVVGWRP